MAALEVAVEVDTCIHAMIVGQAVIVAAADVGCQTVIILVGRVLNGVEFLHCQCGGVAAGEDPADAGIDFVGELVGGDEAHIVPAVVLGWEHPAVVQLLTGTVEEAVGVAPSVANPASELANILLSKELDAVRPSTAHAHLVLPALRAAPERGSVLIFEQVVHIFVIAFDGEVYNVQQVIE